MKAKSIFYGVNCLLERSGPFVRESFTPSPELLDLVQEHAQILVIGAGGLGCELLKNLALSGFRNIDVIDMDTIDLSNLNRQFLFTEKDIGKSKAKVAADFINTRIHTAKVTPYHNKIQDFDEKFYQKYNVVVSGLDSLTARRWMNSMLASLVKYDDNGSVIKETVIPLVDGGTEGFKGNVIVVLYGLTGCLECSIDLYPPQINYPLCTIAQTPRLPEHCIEYVKMIEWGKLKPFSDKPIDTDDPEHLEWIHQRALARANQHKIKGVDIRLVKGVLKGIIPAVASTNATIAATCASEVFKLVTFTHPYLDNYMNFCDIDGVYTFQFRVDKKENCHVCSRNVKKTTIDPKKKLKDFIEYLKESSEYQLRSPSIMTMTSCGKTKSLYISTLAEVLKDNLDKTFEELEVVNSQIILIGDESLKNPISLSICYN